MAETKRPQEGDGSPVACGCGTPLVRDADGWVCLDESCNRHDEKQVPPLADAPAEVLEGVAICADHAPPGSDPTPVRGTITAARDAIHVTRLTLCLPDGSHRGFKAKHLESVEHPDLLEKEHGGDDAAS